MRGMCDAWVDPDTGHALDQANQDLCELTLIALHFKHGIPWKTINGSIEVVDDEEDGVLLYMRCILVNIFMKQIMGMNCLQGPGAQFAFSLADGVLEGFEKKKVGNIACEEKDAGEGGVKGVKAKDRTFWQIMERWFERNMRRVKDGDTGVLGKDCMVQKKARQGGRDEQLGDLTEKVKKQMEEVGHDMGNKVERILPQVKSCTTTECVKSIIDEEQKQDSVPQGPHVKGDGQSGSPPGKPAPAKPGPPPVDNAAGEQPHKPAPAKPAPPAKPVAGKPAEATNTDGAKPGKTKEDDCQGDKVWDWRHRDIYVVQNYTDEHWTKVQKVLKEFIKYLQKNNDNFDSHGANCDNAGWNDFDDVAYYTGQRVADMMRCRLMSGALWFANGGHGGEVNDEELNRLRCEIANVFGHLLRKMYCKDQQNWYRGVEYAWETFQNMGDETLGNGALKGPVTEKRCTMCGYVGNRKNVEAVDLKIAYWLMQEGGISEEIRTLEREMQCNQNWEKYINKHADKEENDINKILTIEGMKEKKRLDQTVLQKAEDVFEKAKKKVDAVIQKKQKEGIPSAGSAVMDSAAGSTTTTRPGSKPQAPASPVLPARPPPPPPPRRPSTPTQGPQGVGSQGAGIGTSPATTTADSHATSPGKATCLGSSGKSTGVSISCASTSDSDLGLTDDVRKLLEAQDTRAHAPRSSNPSSETGDAVVDGGNDDPPPLNPPKPKPNPNPDEAGSTGSCTANSQDGKLCSSAGAIPDGQGARSSGSGNEEEGVGEDPSGTNTIPNPWTSQSDYNKKGCNDNDKSGCDPGLLLNELPGSLSLGEGFVPPTGTDRIPGSKVELPNPSEDNGHFFPDLMDTVLTAITPILFFLTSVAVALLGYSLWKYFAYLGKKRRRIYRTVRDVPSSPLDEEILEHLQRGEAPPPDYGYTMIRDRQPASTSARRRRRPPRVHKRTIIELHLEVLNECEVTEWENVQDAYLQIVVEEFAQDLMRDATGYSSVPDAPITNQDLSGHNVSSTESDGTNASQRNAEHPDPWSCMETIQLERDRCAPNKEDPDPWKCMETIQFATDTSPPTAHDPDPWSCMHTIPLETDTSAPNADDPHPWSCMETMQLAKDPCPPNDWDPWRCMENIQLDAPYSRAPTVPGDATSACIHWIDRNKDILRACTTQPWFLQLTADCKQHAREHMAANGASGEHRKAATMERKKLDAWKEWVSKQHNDMARYKAEQWFQHLLNNVEEQTVSDKGQVPGVDTALAVEQVMGTEDMLRVTDLPRTQALHPQPYMKQPLTAKIWILILALVIEQCEVECRLQQT
ncbi:latent-transforming growth factor beta-binding protein 4 [Plasmodium fragile]|uniref:Latent-transforming growth factor beta-binding protein 4 n=1 Tax=Plasmodium fragile TaxID=5857 RepID=A0A0D9QD83_PLAFR|nr:latent-transforming growth factor beta-binding protein 4 [Plasmodium fragile]KJP84939.1 latent-transforming growth factor beta-binding protein 4 [Plasmodium fragile]